MDTFIVVLDVEKNSRYLIQAQKFEKESGGMHWVFKNESGEEVARFTASKVVAIVKQEALAQSQVSST